MTLYLRYAAKSDVGMVRRENEDSGFAGHSLLAVADGMGGHAAGELASSTAVATLAELDSEDLPTEGLLTALDDAIVTSAERIGQFIDADPSRAGMGTTVTAVLWRAGRIAVIHVGDSRAYLLREGQLTQITHDHTYVQSLIDAGRITEEEARRHPKRNLLLRAIDGSQVPEGETSMREAQAGDRYLLCSDGLTGVVDDAAIARVLIEVSDPTAAVTALVDLALEGGAPDNVTAVVADVVEGDDADLAREATLLAPVVVGAAGEQRNRDALPGLQFPDDVGPDGQAAAGSGPAVAGGLAARGADRVGQDAPPDGMAERDDPEAQPGTPGGVGVGGQGRAATGGNPPAEDARPGFVRRHAVGLAVLALALLGSLMAIAGFSWWLSAQWFVGASDGYVAVYQGIPQQVAGIPMSRVITTTALPVQTLPYYDQQQLGGTIDAGTRAEADRIVSDLAAKAAACAADAAPLGCPPLGPATSPGAAAGTAPTTAPSPLPSLTGSTP